MKLRKKLEGSNDRSREKTRNAAKPRGSKRETSGPRSVSRREEIEKKSMNENARKGGRCEPTRKAEMLRETQDESLLMFVRNP